MTWTDWKTAESVANINDGGALPWQDDDASALEGDELSAAGDSKSIRVGNALNSYTSQIARARNFSFAVPSTSTITGIKARITRRTASGTTTSDHTIRLAHHSAGSSADQVGSNMASGTAWPTTFAAVEYGGTGNLWGTTLTPAQANSANFSLDIKAANTGTALSYIDCVKIALDVEEDPPELGDLTLVAKANVTITGNSVEKTSGSFAWDAGAYSQESWEDDIEARATITQVDDFYQMLALNSDPTSGVSFTVLDYAIYANDGVLDIYESGSAVQSNVGTVSDGDELFVRRVGTDIEYGKNNTVLHTKNGVSASTPLHLEMALVQTGGEFTGITFDEPGGSVELTANNLSTAIPTLGTPALGLIVALTATALAAAAPVSGSPALEQVHALTASDLSAGAPVLDTPDVNEATPVAADPLTTGQPTLGSPALGTIHNFNATGLASQPVLDNPSLAQRHALTADALTGGAPVLGEPSLGTGHNLAATALGAQAPALGQPALGQVHAFTAGNLVAGAPLLGSPTGTFGWQPVSATSVTWTPATGEAATWTPVEPEPTTWEPQ